MKFDDIPAEFVVKKNPSTSAVKIDVQGWGECMSKLTGSGLYSC